jgi:chromatin remodeling complex protein RSC6
MPKGKKTSTDVAETTPVVNTPAVETQQSTTVETKQKKPRAPKVETPVVSTAPATVPVTESVEQVPQEEVVGEQVSDDLVAQSVDFLTKLNQLGAMIASLKTEYRVLEKRWSRELKTAQKTSSKRKRKSGNRAPSGFVKPTRISDELAKFLDKPTGTEMARTDVTREINKYIRSHDLQDKENGRKINPDAKLQSLLKLKKSDELTYFNLQRYMSQHFAKSVKPTASVTA